MNNTIYVGEEAKNILADILNNQNGDRYPKHENATGYFRDKNVYVAFDNTTCDCWVEEFATAKKAVNWIKNG